MNDRKKLIIVENLSLKGVLKFSIIQNDDNYLCIFCACDIRFVPKLDNVSKVFLKVNTSQIHRSVF